MEGFKIFKLRLGLFFLAAAFWAAFFGATAFFGAAAFLELLPLGLLPF